MSKKSKILLLLLIIAEVVAVKMIMFKILPDKFFYDSRKILYVMYGWMTADKAYTYAGTIFGFINFFKLTSLEQWSTYISIIFTPIIIYNLLKDKKYTLTQIVFILASIGLISIYVLGITKDIIQFTYFLVLYFIISRPKLSNIKKLFLSSLVLLYEALNFRIYYAIMALLMVTIYSVYMIFIKNKKINKSMAFKIIITSTILFFLEVLVVQFISIDNYNSIMNARYSVNNFRENSLDALTIIKDPLGINYNFIIFMGNYVINMIRFLFPVELLFIGIRYLIFIVYQLYVSINIIKSCKYINEKNILWIVTVISFIMISIIFEPDFGSFIRHEAAMTLFLVMITNIVSEGKNKKIITKNNSSEQK